jgi:hypothetical protein
MDFQPERYVRKPFPVDVFLVTKQNMNFVAKWCGGQVCETMEPHKRHGLTHIKVPVPPAKSPRNNLQTMAFIGDRVVKFGSIFRVYRDKTFVEQFDKAPKGRALKIESLSLDLHPGPYGGIPEVIDPPNRFGGEGGIGDGWHDQQKEAQAKWDRALEGARLPKAEIHEDHNYGTKLVDDDDLCTKHGISIHIHECEGIDH